MAQKSVAKIYHIVSTWCFCFPLKQSREFSLSSLLDPEYVIQISHIINCLFIYVIWTNICAACVAAGTAYGLLCIACLGCAYSCCYRSRLRAEYDLQEGPVPDFLVHCCCETCALCQEYRELKIRGFDMGIGKNKTIYALGYIYIIYRCHCFSKATSSCTRVLGKCNSTSTNIILFYRSLVLWRVGCEHGSAETRSQRHSGDGRSGCGPNDEMRWQIW